MITEITPEQKGKIPEWVKTWTDLGLSVEPADFDRAEAAVITAYRLIGAKKPTVVLRMGSPFGSTFGGIFAKLLLSCGQDQVMTQVGAQVRDQVMTQVRDQVRAQVGTQVMTQVRDQVRDQVWDQVRAQVWAQVMTQVRDQVRDQVWDQVRAQVGTQVMTQVRDQVWDQVGTQVWDQVRDQVWDQVRAQVMTQVGTQVMTQVRDQVNNNYGGSLYSSAWCAYVTYLRDVLGWSGDTLPHFRIDEELAYSCNWVWWQDDVVAISDRPAEIHLDDRGRLHSHTGPSIRYRDGWSLYHSHGTAVPASWIEDRKTLTPTVALTSANAELRRAGCEILGWDSILRELGATVIDTDRDPQVGELVEVEIPEIGRERFLRVVCGTGRTFALPVPPTMTTALEANAWTYDIPTDLLQQKEHRT